MATIVLQAAGAFLGGALGPIGAAVGSAAGAMAGYAIDRALINSTRHYEGPRLAAARPFTAEEGAPLPRLYGTVRTGGTLIWATRFEEESTTTRQGFKGGPKTTNYSYFANAAFALCDGEIAGVRRIWADGREIDREQVEIRVHTGSAMQQPDPLIEAKQGTGNAPAYRGTAYVVIDRFPIDDYGRRLPQFQFEVLRPVGKLNQRIRSVALIPGATEYGLSPGQVTMTPRPGEATSLNRNTLVAASDFEASLDELQMLCPNLETVALVVSWFGTDLRAAQCQIRPMVTHGNEAGLSSGWQVSGVARAGAQLVSQTGEDAAYGGTPSDQSVIDAIAAIRQRGLKAWLYPFIMMDVPEGNGLENPYGGTGQPSYPWRGRMTCNPAPGSAGTVDKTAAARSQIEVIAGTAVASDFTQGASTVYFNGNADDWSYRRFLLHYAHLATQAGGVDGFLVGSELRGLTTVRDEANRFPFVETLQQLAGDVRGVLGAGATITYGADWSEYFGYHPADGSGDVFFHLDDLWADAAVDAVGIDNYIPLSDWRDEDYAGGNPDGFAGPYDEDGLRKGITSGEGHDWYYASDGDRKARQRTPITDGGYGKPWVFRYKDIRNWWSNPHFNRIGGVEEALPTAWVPEAKPVLFTEFGCAAVDKGPNQPNVFPDPKSSENAVPYFSNGGRCDLAQHRYLSAHLSYWEGETEGNPVSSLYGGRMVDPTGMFIWAWDARPFPAFPLFSDVWGDGENWSRGHWLNGRSSGVTAGDLINAILADHGLAPADTDKADGEIAGYSITNPTTARAAIEPVADLFGIGAHANELGLVFTTLGANASGGQALEDLVVDGNGAIAEKTRDPDHALPAELHVDFRNQMNEHQSATVLATHAGAKGRSKAFLSFPGVLAAAEASKQAQAWLHRRWAARESIAFSIPYDQALVSPGSIIRLPRQTGEADYLVSEIEDGVFRTVQAQRILRLPPVMAEENASAGKVEKPVLAAKPHALFLDLPMQSDEAAPQDRFQVAVRAKPWRSQSVFASPEDTGYAFRNTLTKRAVMGSLTTSLQGGFEGRFDHGGSIDVALFDSELRSISQVQLLNGGNGAAIRSNAGTWEVIQFAHAEEIGPSLWRLSRLLRGQLGTGDAMASGAESGAPFVLLNEAVQPAGLSAQEIGLALNWRVGPAGYAMSDALFLTSQASGGLRALLPLSPVHLRGRQVAAGDVELEWIRRGRLGADSWQGDDVPLGEARERYLVEVAATGGSVVRSTTVSQPAWTYTVTAMATDFAQLPDALDVTVRQISEAVGLGVPARQTIHLV